MTEPEWAQKARQEIWAEEDRRLFVAAKEVAKDMDAMAGQLKVRARLDRVHKHTRTAFRAEMDHTLRAMQAEAGPEGFDQDVYQALALLTLYQVLAEHCDALPAAVGEAVLDLFPASTMPYRPSHPCYSPPLVLTERENPNDRE